MNHKFINFSSPFSILFFPKLYTKETTEMKLMVSESVGDSFTHYP